MTNRSEYAINAICPYFTMFPLRFPLSVIKKAARGREFVLDPFCGRGTTNLASRLLGIPTCGIDSSPIAVAATSAKLVNSVSPAGIVLEAKNILDKRFHVDVPTGAFWRLAFRPKVLNDICKLREILLRECRSDVRKALRGILLGALHGPLRSGGSSSYFSNQAPRTYAPKPNYAVGFWRRTGFRAPDVSVLEIIRDRAERYYGELPSPVRHRVRVGDARMYSAIKQACGGNRPTLIITSPPYYGLRTYVADQWLRHWLLGGPDKVDYRYGLQLSHRSVSEFIGDLQLVWSNVAEVSANRARLVFRFGAINDRFLDPCDIIHESLRNTPWQLKTIVNAGTAQRGKRQSETFVRRQREPIVEFDAWAIRC